MKYFYGVLCLIGIVLPYGAFIPWVVENGIDFSTLMSEAFSTKVSAFAWLDVIVSAVVLIGFILVESKRLSVKNWWVAVIGTLLVGVSFGLPLFLLLREIHLEKQKAWRETQASHHGSPPDISISNSSE